ncbi:MAG: PAS domain S-box protein, partial [Euryarchaeota archaeon]|nr:PAS domain S-box protein [Euryarchaeota archaeon]
MTATPNAQPINVLLIEDNEVDTRLVTELLHDTPHDRFNIITASTLSKGLALLSTNSVDVILLDLGLPDSQGLDTFHAIYKQASHLPIIVLTVSDDEALGQRVLREGAQRFLSKDTLTLGAPYAGIFTRMIRFAIEQKRAEAALTVSEEHYRELVNNLDALILWVDPTLHITFANEYALTLLGYTAEEFLGRHVIGTLLPSTESTGRDLEQMADDIISRPSDYRHNRNEVITKDGRRLWIEWTNTPQHDEEGIYTGVFSTGIDVTERVAIEQALKTSEEQFQSLFNSSAIAQVYYDATGSPVRANQATLALFGIADVSALQRMTIFSSPRMTDDDKAQLRAGQSVEYEQRYDFDAIKASGGFETTNVGKRYVHVFFTPLLDTKTGGIDGYLGQITDITDRTRAEHLLQEAHQDVQALNEQLQFTNEQLRLVNEALEEHVQERTTELAATTASLKKEVAVRQRAEAMIKRRVHELEVINEIVMIGSTARDLPSLLSQILTKTLAFTDLGVGHVRLLHDDKLTLECSHGLPSQYVEEQREIPINDPLFDPVLQTGKPRFEEAFEDIDSARARGSALQTAGAIPLLSGRKVIGVLGFGSQQRRRLSKEQKGLLELIGREAGTVIAKMQAQQALTHELAITEAITRLTPLLLFPSLDLDDLLLAILEDAKRLTGSALGFIALIEPHTKDVIAYGHTQMMLDECAIPEAQRQVRFPIGPDGHYHGLWGHALNERRGFFTNAPAQHPAAAGTPEGHAALEQFLAVPAFVSGEVVGEIALANPGRPYTRHDVAVVGRLAEELFSLAVMRMQGEEQVRASSLYTRSLIEASLDPLVTINAEGTITDVNTATEDVTGCSRSELIGSDFSDFFTEPDKADAGYRQVFTEGFVRDYPLAIRHVSGKVTDVLYNATVYRNEAGEIQGVFAAARDVTELKQAEEATRAHAHR